MLDDDYTRFRGGEVVLFATLSLEFILLTADTENEPNNLHLRRHSHFFDFRVLILLGRFCCLESWRDPVACLGYSP